MVDWRILYFGVDVNWKKGKENFWLNWLSELKEISRGQKLFQLTSSPADGVKKNETLNGASLILGLRDVVVVDQSRGGSHVTDLANYF